MKVTTRVQPVTPEQEIGESKIAPWTVSATSKLASMDQTTNSLRNAMTTSIDTGSASSTQRSTLVIQRSLRLSAIKTRESSRCSIITRRLSSSLKTSRSSLSASPKTGTKRKPRVVPWMGWLGHFPMPYVCISGNVTSSRMTARFSFASAGPTPVKTSTISDQKS
jgi:hypothetical protein